MLNEMKACSLNYPQVDYATPKQLNYKGCFSGRWKLKNKALITYFDILRTVEIMIENKKNI